MEKLTTKKELFAEKKQHLYDLGFKVDRAYDNAFKIAKDFGFVYTFIGGVLGVWLPCWARSYYLITTPEAIHMGLAIFGSLFTAGTLMNAGMICWYTHDARMEYNAYEKMLEPLMKECEEEKSL